MIGQIVNFFSDPFVIIVGGFSTLFILVTRIYSIFVVLRGVLPVGIRLGKGLSKSKIAVFSINEFNNLQDMIVDSKIFKKENIVQITKKNLKKAANTNVFLIHWKEFQEELLEILALKKDNTALIIYAPQAEGRIENQELLNKIELERNCVLVNFRGRLMNDIVTSLITVNYEQQ